MQHKNTMLSFLLFLIAVTTNAQVPLDPGWLWAERGGSSASILGNQLNSFGMERIVDIAVDGNNNYYYLAEVGGYNFTLGDMDFDTYNDNETFIRCVQLPVGL